MESLITQFGIAWPKLLAQGLIFWAVYFILNKKAFGPILAMLEQRKQRIADGEAKLEKISKDLAAAEANAKAIIDKANADSDRLIKDAGDSAKAREAAQLEHEQLMSQLKREFGRMVADATGRVTGKVLNNDDQARINAEAAAQVSA